MWLMLAWALMTWIPGVAGSAFHNVIGIPVIPVAKLFSFVSVGSVSFGLVIVSYLLHFLANWLERRFVADNYAQSADVPDPSPQDSRRGGGDY